MLDSEETVEAVDETTAGEVVEATETPEEEVTASFGEEPEPEPQNWVNELRKREREAQRELRDLKRKMQDMQPREVEIPKPTLEGVGYDAEKFEADLLAWNEQQAKKRAEAEKRRADEEAQATEFQKMQAAYVEGKKSLNAPDFDDAEAVVLETLSEVQQGIILGAVTRPAEFVLALGKNPAKARELAAIKDPIKLAAAMARLETTMQVTRKAPPPENKVIGTAAISSASGRLAKLHEAAQSSGDYTEYLAEKRRIAKSAAVK